MELKAAYDLVGLTNFVCTMQLLIVEQMPNLASFCPKLRFRPQNDLVLSCSVGFLPEHLSPPNIVFFYVYSSINSWQTFRPLNSTLNMTENNSDEFTGQKFLHPVLLPHSSAPVLSLLGCGAVVLGDCVTAVDVAARDVDLEPVDAERVVQIDHQLRQVGKSKSRLRRAQIQYIQTGQHLCPILNSVTKCQILAGFFWPKLQLLDFFHTNMLKKLRMKALF